MKNLASNQHVVQAFQKYSAFETLYFCRVIRFNYFKASNASARRAKRARRVKICLSRFLSNYSRIRVSIAYCWLRLKTIFLIVFLRLAIRSVFKKLSLSKIQARSVNFSRGSQKFVIRTHA